MNILLRWLTDAPLAESIAGDLEEQRRRRAERSRVFASLWYWRRSIALAVFFIGASVRRAVAGFFHRGSLGQGGIGGDVRQALRAIRRRPALTLTIVFTLAVGLGTNVAIFSVIDATLLRPLPYPHASRVVFIEAAEDGSKRASDPLPSWTRAWTAGARAFERVEWRVSRSALVKFGTLGGAGSFGTLGAGAGSLGPLGRGGGAATRVRMMDVSGGYLDAIGARPILGRAIIRADALPGAPRVTVLSQRFWRQRFGGDPGAVGGSLSIDGVFHTIVGVASDLESDVAGLTFALATALHDDGDREPARAVAWLRPGTRLEDAQAELDAVAPIQYTGHAIRPRLARPSTIFWRIPLFRATELGFITAALLVLAIAGVNLSHLFLAAGQERVGELTLRRALGASTFRVVRLLFVETLTLALAGSAVGLAIAWALVQWLTSLDAGSQWQTRLDSIHIDPVIVAYAIGLGCVVSLVFGLWPAVRSARQRSFLADGSTRGSRRRRVSTSMLMAVETGLSAVLLIVAGVVGHAFVAMQLTPRGFDADRILSVRVSLPADRYPTLASRTAFFDRLAGEAAAIPGVERSGIGYGAMPPSDFTLAGTFAIDGSKGAPVETWIGMGYVTPGYFALMGIPMLQGSDFSSADLTARRPSDAAQPVVISRSMANRFWTNGSALGALFRTADRRGVRHYRVIGIAGDVSVWGMLTQGCQNCDPQFYLPIPEERMYTDVLFRLRPGAAPPAEALQAAIAKLDPDVPADDELRTGEASLRQWIRQPRFTAALFAGFASIAIILVAIGLSAVVSRSVTERTLEMGIRLALGATPGSVWTLVVKEGLRPALVGLAAGFIAALGVTRAIRALLYGLSPTDPLTLALAPLLLAAIVIAALAVPALRATRVDPAETLRQE